LVTFVTVKIVFSPRRSSKAVSKYGSRSVAAGATAMSQLSLFRVVPPEAADATARRRRSHSWYLRIMG
jgi:hypothetical protein